MFYSHMALGNEISMSTDVWLAIETTSRLASDVLHVFGLAKVPNAAMGKGRALTKACGEFA